MGPGRRRSTAAESTDAAAGDPARADGTRVWRRAVCHEADAPGRSHGDRRDQPDPRISLDSGETDLRLPADTALRAGDDPGDGDTHGVALAGNPASTATGRAGDRDVRWRLKGGRGAGAG